MLSGLAYSEHASVEGREALPRPLCIPPRGFRSGEGVRRAWPEQSGPFGRTPSLRGKTAAQKAGIRYERRVVKELDFVYNNSLRPGQWFKWEDAAGLHWCQLDALVVTDPLLILFEVKSRFTSDAWFQLRRLYEPVARRAFYMTPAACVIVCRSMDPWVKLPEPYTVITSPAAIDPTVLNVLPWRL